MSKEKMVKGFPKQLIDDLKILHGLPPHNGGSNVCMGDGYYAMSLERKWGKAMIDKATRAVIEPMQNEVDRAVAAVERKYR